MERCFAAIYERGPNWIAGKPITQQPLSEHVAYLMGLHDQSVVAMGGPFADETGGLVILAVTDSDEAARLIDHDPAVQSGVLKAQVREWRRIV